MKRRKHKNRKPKEHPFVRGMRELAKANETIREYVIDMMYNECLDIAEKNLKSLRDYIR